MFICVDPFPALKNLAYHSSVSGLQSAHYGFPLSPQSSVLTTSVPHPLHLDCIFNGAGAQVSGRKQLVARRPANADS